MAGCRTAWRGPPIEITKPRGSPRRAASTRRPSKLNRHDDFATAMAEELERLTGLVQRKLVESRSFQVAVGCELRQRFQPFGVHLGLDVDSSHAVLLELVAGCRAFHRNYGPA